MVIIIIYLLLTLLGCNSDQEEIIRRDLLNICLRQRITEKNTLKSEALWVKHRIKSDLIKQLYQKKRGVQKEIRHLLDQYHIKYCPVLYHESDQYLLTLAIDLGYGEPLVTETMQQLNTRLQSIAVQPATLKGNRIHIHYKKNKDQLVKRLIQKGEIDAVFIDDQLDQEHLDQLQRGVKLIDKGWLKYL